MANYEFHTGELDFLVSPTERRFFIHQGAKVSKVPTQYICYLRAPQGDPVLHQLYMNPGRAGSTVPAVDVVLQRYGGEWRLVPTIDLKEGSAPAKKNWWRIW